MKITIEKSALETVQKLRGELAAWLKTITGSTSELDRLELDKKKLTDEIAALENATAISEATGTKLAAKREQLALIQRKIDNLSNVSATTNDSQQREISTLLREFARAAASATAPGITAYCKEAADKMRPWCSSDADAQALAYALPAAKSLIANYAWPFGSSLFSTGELKRAVARADEIISGELAWNWDAKINA